MAQFTDKEKELINSGTSQTPFYVLEVTTEEDSLFLRQKSSDITPVTNNKELQLLIERLKLTMEVESGVGIAAPQVGIAKNVFIFTRLDMPEAPIVAAVNPRIVKYPDNTVCFENDGCLSIPDMSGNTVRYPWIEVEYINEQGELIRERLEGYSRAGNFTGVIFQHEYDHLQGILYIDRLCPEQVE